jgi:hypothetical protein
MKATAKQEHILAGHFLATRERIPCGEELFLVVHDTTEFSYKREDMAAVGLVSKDFVRKNAQGRPVYFTTCGINLHSSLTGDSGRAAAGLDCRQVLEPKSIQRSESEKKGSSRSD